MNVSSEKDRTQNWSLWDLVRQKVNKDARCEDYEVALSWFLEGEIAVKFVAWFFVFFLSSNYIILERRQTSLQLIGINSCITCQIILAILQTLDFFYKMAPPCGGFATNTPLPLSLFRLLLHQSCAGAAAVGASLQTWRAARRAAVAAALVCPPRSGGCWMYNAVSAALGGSLPPPLPPHRLLSVLRGCPTR